MRREEDSVGVIAADSATGNFPGANGRTDVQSGTVTPHIPADNMTGDLILR
ncbi:MAG TPA: hypothetical protein VGD71_32555 [Kribbella sp.]